MFQLSVQDIHPGQQASNKRGDSSGAAALVSAGNVAKSYLTGCWLASGKPPHSQRHLPSRTGLPTRVTRC